MSFNNRIDKLLYVPTWATLHRSKNELTFILHINIGDSQNKILREKFKSWKKNIVWVHLCRDWRKADPKAI